MRLRILVSMTMAALLGACAIGGARGGGPSDAETAAAAARAELSQDAVYHLGTGDKVRVITFGELALTGEFVVSSTGEIALPLVGGVKVAGLTVPQAQQAIEAPLRGGYLKDPHVSVEVLNFRPYYILGEVNKPGEYPYSSNLTVTNAVAVANGFTYRANTRFVFLKHLGQTTEQQVELIPGLPVRPGDTIRVKERYF